MRENSLSILFILKERSGLKTVNVYFQKMVNIFQERKKESTGQTNSLCSIGDPLVALANLFLQCPFEFSIFWKIQYNVEFWILLFFFQIPGIDVVKPSTPIVRLISMTEGCLRFRACDVEASYESSMEYHLVAWWEREI
ncbi:LOW QUALITY PROTEIN: hypothetical protein TorRG33x02_040740 [Trema orientale]|uniref:Uncharacterized protein n=1 Tax=Trema orientale TaxID=63057 RepID=A0A2P5FR73_TREOI|nr:LOW QUALITY PROTEIN: hypothetical protein TorRG33x02_040740 [Trema orientale]